MTWDHIARRQAGVISRAQLAEAGVTDKRTDSLVAAGALRRHARSVFVVRGAPVTDDAELWIAVLATNGVIGFGTAAHVWQMAERPAQVDIIVGCRRRLAAQYGVRLYHVFVPRSAVVRHRGLPVTARAWSILDHLGQLPVPAAMTLLDRGLQQRWVSRTDLQHRLDDYPGRRGNKQLRCLLAGTSDGAAAVSERILHRLLRDAGIGGWTANYRVMAGGRLVAVLDVALVVERIAVEVDGWAFHSDVERFRRDRHRQNRLAALGWTVLRFTWHDLNDRPDYVLATVRAQVARAARS